MRTEMLELWFNDSAIELPPIEDCVNPGPAATCVGRMRTGPTAAPASVQLQRSKPMNARSHAIAMVLAGGIVAGVLGISYAGMYWSIKADVPAQRIFQSVASGLLGKASFQGGTQTAALGLGLHFFITLMMSAAYYLVARRVPLLVERPWLCGALYGLALYGVMNFVVVPLSAAPPPSGPRDALWIGLSVLVHIGFVGLPIALFARSAMTTTLSRFGAVDPA
jgi:hypothetical protein